MLLFCQLSKEPWGHNSTLSPFFPSLTMPFTGQPWNALRSHKTPRVRQRELPWPWNLYKLEVSDPLPRSESNANTTEPGVFKLADPGDELPQTVGGPEGFALTNDQRDFVFACAVFSRQAKEEGCEGEFMGMVYGRFFSRWPTPVSNLFAWTVAKRKEVCAIRAPHR
jgi:hypothetical protein